MPETPHTSSEQIARILGTIDSDVVSKVLHGESTQDRDLDALTALATESRKRAAKLLGDDVDITTLEDLGAETLGLPTVTNILEEYEELREIRDGIIRSIAVTTEHLFDLQAGKPVTGKTVDIREDVLTPPGEVKSAIEPGDGRGIVKDFQERLATIQLILLDLGFDGNDVQITIGEVTDTMVRDLTYVSVFVPKLGRLIELCNEIGNRSFVWNTTEEADIARFGAMTKDEKLEYQRSNVGSGTDVVMQRGWEETMRTMLLANEINPSERQKGVEGKIMAMQWKKKFEELEAFVKAHNGKFPDAYSEDAGEKSLAMWLRFQRTRLRDNKLSEEQASAFKTLDIQPAKKRKAFAEWVAELKIFLNQNAGESPRIDSEDPQEKSLAVWLNTQRAQMKDDVFPKDQLSALQVLNIEPTKTTEKQKTFEQWIVLLKEYLDTNEGNFPPTDLKGIGSWLNTQRSKMRKKKLPDKQLAELQALGVQPAQSRKDPMETFRRNVEKMKKFMAEHDSKLPPSGGQGIGNWLGIQRMKMRDGTLTEEQDKIMKDLGVTPAERKEEIEQTFDQWVEVLKTYIAEHNGEIPTMGGKGLGAWLHSQRAKMRDVKLTDDQKKTLEELGITPAKLGKKRSNK